MLGGKNSSFFSMCLANNPIAMLIVNIFIGMNIIRQFICDGVSLFVVFNFDNSNRIVFGCFFNNTTIFEHSCD